jgi:6-phosphogluconate dehydrogenase
MIGLGVMGSNLVLNMADRGLLVGVFNRTASVTKEFVSSLQPGQQVRAAYSLQELLAGLTRPRRIMLMVNAGKAVDAVIGELEPLLQPEDIVIDGGNSHYLDTDRRAAALAARGVHFLGVGISGGESGARHGPSMMPGGPAAAYDAVRPIFESVAARVDGRPCVAYLGPGSAGHYVKMVHNGIEYAFMQLISESYALLKQALAVDNDHLAELFTEWQGAELGSYLVEITAKIFRRRDEETGGSLIDLILGEAGQKGTGMWTSQSAMDLRVPVPSIDVAVSMRNLSALVEEREAARRALASVGLSAAEPAPLAAGAVLSVDKVRAALYAAMVISYCQGFAQLNRASEILGYGLDLREVASIWQGGCIIRSSLLGLIATAFELRPSIRNPLLDPELGKAVSVRRPDLAQAVSAGVAARIPVPGLAAALSYFDGYAATWSPTNLIQAQRDFFGAHTYGRTDREGVFHTDWSLGPE